MKSRLAKALTVLALPLALAAAGPSLAATRFVVWPVTFDITFPEGADVAQHLVWMRASFGSEAERFFKVVEDCVGSVMAVEGTKANIFSKRCELRMPVFAMFKASVLDAEYRVHLTFSYKGHDWKCSIRYGKRFYNGDKPGFASFVTSKDHEKRIKEMLDGLRFTLTADEMDNCRVLNEKTGKWVETSAWTCDGTPSSGGLPDDF